jgi:hypothetical protein
VARDARRHAAILSLASATSPIRVYPAEVALYPAEAALYPAEAALYPAEAGLHDERIT